MPGGWVTVQDAARALEASPAERALLVVDDAHGLEGTAAEVALGRFVEYAPRWLAIVIGSRLAPSINLSRLRVAGDLVEIGPDDLRFRAWEVERLFRDHYGEPVPPDELAVLARRTEGWAAGLQLFHLATRGKSADERRRILAAVGAGSRLIREYLTWNVLADLPEELREFLVETCVLGRLTGPLCDKLLGRRGSAALLAELYRRQIFTVELDEADESYRYHEVFRRSSTGCSSTGWARRRPASATPGPGRCSRRPRRPRRRWGVQPGRGLGRGPAVAGRPRRAPGDSAPAWLESLPPAIVRHEPWLELASARRARAEGRWNDALEAFGRAEGGFGASSIALVCHRERQALRTWFEPGTPGPTSDWSRILRSGVVREPMSIARDALRQDGVPPSSCGGCSRWPRARSPTPGGSWPPPGRGCRRTRCSRPRARWRRASRRCSRGTRPPVPRTSTRPRTPPNGPGAVAGTPRPDRRSPRPPEGAAPLDAAARAAFDPERDPWGAAIASLAEAWEPGVDQAKPVAGHANGTANGVSPGTAAERRVAAAERAAAEFRRLGSGVLEAWARGLLAIGLAEVGSSEAREAATSAERLARAAGRPAPGCSPTGRCG